MTDASAHFAPGTIQPLSGSAKQHWELGQVRVVACGAVADDGRLHPAGAAEAAWQLSVRSIERSGAFHDSAAALQLTLIAGDFIQLHAHGQSRGLEPLRPLKITTTGPIEVSQPAEELLVLHLSHDPARVRATVRIVELSKDREQHLFDGQLGLLLQGRAKLLSSAEDERPVQLRDTIYGGDEAQVRLLGRGFLAVVSLDPADR